MVKNYENLNLYFRNWLLDLLSKIIGMSTVCNCNCIHLYLICTLFFRTKIVFTKKLKNNRIYISVIYPTKVNYTLYNYTACNSTWTCLISSIETSQVHHIIAAQRLMCTLATKFKRDMILWRQ